MKSGDEKIQKERKEWPNIGVEHTSLFPRDACDVVRESMGSEWKERENALTHDAVLWMIVWKENEEPGKQHHVCEKRTHENRKKISITLFPFFDPMENWNIDPLDSIE